MHEWSASTQYHGTPAGHHPPLGVAGENEEGGKMIGYFRKRKSVAWIVTLLLSVTILFGMSGTTVSAATGAVADDTTALTTGTILLQLMTPQRISGGFGRTSPYLPATL